MLQFLSPLICQALDDGVNWELHEPLAIDLGMTGMTEPLIIPVGFVTDFGSIPWFIPNWIANPQGKAKRAYVMHDYLYRTQIFTQLVSDALLNEGMIVEGVNWFQRFTVYRGLRLGGWVAWDKYAKTPYVPPK
jgi:hypothetical protein